MVGEDTHNVDVGMQYFFRLFFNLPSKVTKVSDAPRTAPHPTLVQLRQLLRLWDREEVCGKGELGEGVRIEDRWKQGM